MRAFLALSVPEPVQAALGRLIQELRSAGDGAKWVHPSQIHLTLKFFAELTAEGLAALDAAVPEACAAAAPFPVAVDGLGSFGPADAVRVVWAGVQDPEGGLSAFQARLEERLARAGFPREERPFTAHLTLCRVRSPRRNPALRRRLSGRGSLALGSFRVDRLALYSSMLSPLGPEHRVERSYLFGGAV